ncbi:hypothetical protein Val02_74710 [Virgisporangium aliadipatigenens]|uniref:Thioredoxin n=1 Tax=Virgisporangium aliadipatigenens TaxID=741659 RepID=A0A8J3YVI9_9ACTN|nr:thioredoxin family protein [Virgisporangium aliadipatigenens]GIJ50585.1 hypothetical protein Val02_74710 [Virgisporangium aliadipatigenens]
MPKGTVYSAKRFFDEVCGELNAVPFGVVFGTEVAERASKVSERFTIRAVPTLILMLDGKVVARRAGAAPVSARRTRVYEVLRGAA